MTASMIINASATPLWTGRANGVADPERVVVSVTILENVYALLASGAVGVGAIPLSPPGVHVLPERLGKEPPEESGR